MQVSNITVFREIIPENPNPDKFDLIRKPDKLTTKKHPEYNHLLICERVYELVEKSQDEIIERLNTELGNYLDTEYPLWERTKHAGEGNYILLAMINDSVTDEQLQRKTI